MGFNRRLVFLGHPLRKKWISQSLRLLQQLSTRILPLQLLLLFLLFHFPQNLPNLIGAKITWTYHAIKGSQYTFIRNGLFIYQLDLTRMTFPYFCVVWPVKRTRRNILSIILSTDGFVISRNHIEILSLSRLCFDFISVEVNFVGKDGLQFFTFMITIFILV